MHRAYSLCGHRRQTAHGSLGQPWSTHSKSLSPGGGQAVCLCLSYTSLLRPG